MMGGEQGRKGDGKDKVFAERGRATVNADRFPHNPTRQTSNVGLGRKVDQES